MDAPDSHLHGISPDQESYKEIFLTAKTEPFNESFNESSETLGRVFTG